MLAAMARQYLLNEICKESPKVFDLCLAGDTSALQRLRVTQAGEAVIGRASHDAGHALLLQNVAVDLFPLRYRTSRGYEKDGTLLALALQGKIDDFFHQHGATPPEDEFKTESLPHSPIALAFALRERGWPRDDLVVPATIAEIETLLDILEPLRKQQQAKIADIASTTVSKELQAAFFEYAKSGVRFVCEQLESLMLLAMHDGGDPESKTAKQQLSLTLGGP